ncbi:hypothetical protein N7478_011195 [Penicillium angulare]|uniref:uncharacterized protein n=1 Tax=Penicillium angulare TaxID=116970 RepID=UPI002540F91D|nr:uncharacterized protein N7478_011195 [Penicillium angulare]KAJ5263590.1 hypothetical protein N7478_011195 [Penicillium angulare]
MASTPRISLFRLKQDSPQWQHLLRATLQECSYLPDPIARTYMRSYVLDRYRRAFESKIPEEKLTRSAKKGLSMLQRANEGYPKPLDKVMLMSYGRIGKRRHELIAQLLKPEAPIDTNSLRELITSVPNYQDGWEPPQIVTRLLKSQMNHGVATASRLRPQLKHVVPAIPETNSWGRPVAQSRRANIRRKWYIDTLYSLLPPLPEQELGILNSLMAGTVPWRSFKQRPVEAPAVQDDSVLDFLMDGPQKGQTFGSYVHGRPHKITSRSMRRLWKRISGLVPRMHWNDASQKWSFHWDSAKVVPQVAFELDQDSDLDEIFGEPAPAKPSSKGSAQS